MTLAGKNASIYITGSSVSISNEPCSPYGTGTPVLKWRVDNEDNRVLDWDATFSVEVSTDGGSTWTTASTSNYSLLYTVGAIVFDSDPFGGSTSGNDVRIASGEIRQKFKIIEAYATDPGIDPDLQDVTHFGDDGPRRQAAKKDVEATFSSWRVVERELDGANGSEATLEEILLGEETRGGTGDIDRNVVYVYDPDIDTSRAGSRVLGATVQMDTIDLSASQGSPQEKEVSMVASQQVAAMSSQTVEAVETIAAA